MGDKLNKSQSVLHRIKVLDVVQDELPWAMFERTDVGMGDMQRGSVMLRAASEGRPLVHVRAAGAVRSRARGRVGNTARAVAEAPPELTPPACSP